MDQLRKRPIVLVAAAVLLGVVLESYLKLSPTTSAAVVLFFACLSVYVYLKKYHHVFISIPLFIAFGVLYSSVIFSFTPKSEHVLSYADGEYKAIEGVVKTLPAVKGEAFRFIIDVSAIEDDSSGFKGSSGFVLVNLRGVRELKEPPRIKDVIRVYGRLKEVKNFGNPGEYDYQSSLGRLGVFASISVSEGRYYSLRKGSGLLNTLNKARNSISARIDDAQLKNGGLIKALLLGEKGAVPFEMREGFIRAGGAHLLAISGLHVGFIAWLSYLCFSWCLRRSTTFSLAYDVRITALILSLIPILFYGAIAGYPVSTQRAVAMVMAFVLSIGIGRVRDIYSAIGFAALVVMIVSPVSPWEVSFLLSFSAVFSIAWLVVPLKGMFASIDVEERSVLSKISGGVKVGFFVSLAATLGTAPITINTFNMFTPSSVISNIITVPVAGLLVLPSAFIAVILMPVSTVVSNALLNVSDVFASVLVGLMEFFSSAEYSSIWMLKLSGYEVVIYYVGFLSIPFVLKKKSRPIALTLFISCVVLLIAADIYKTQRSIPDKLRVTFISVGQGDAALIEVPPTRDEPVKRLLIDGGGFFSTDFDIGRSVVAPLLWKKGIRNLDYVILSHPQIDHMGGLAFMIDNFDPDEFWWSGIGELSNEMKEAINTSGVRSIKKGLGSEVTSVNELQVEYLWPELREGSDYDTKEVNDSSLVMRLSYGEKSFLFTGDIGRKVEAMIMDSVNAVDVLKVAHHGSATSSSEEFIRKVKPDYAVFSIGYANRFNHPNERVVITIRSGGAKLLYTSIDGAITFETDGIEIRQSTDLTNVGVF
ncbi:MAG: DNA internalization-related competence protein ComEC/Rec2 [Deltaproteobacteria bacterium]|nr:DNA internalization-related competence protein ComEC/Rec2 [Deltaproteobacteria bacterium]